MTTVSANSDVWVIQDDHALLYRQHEKVWVLESRMPFTDFHGSAAALASFTLADTCVYLNIRKSDQFINPADELRWVAIEQSPLRMKEFPHTVEQVQIQHSIKSMGKKINAIAIEDPAKFFNAPTLFLADRQESAHLKTWIKSQKNGVSRHWATVHFYVALWIKPGQQQQKLRLVALVCMALSIAAMNWGIDRQMKNHDFQWQKSIKESLANPTSTTSAVSFEEWATQIKKFGQNNRSNLRELNIYWSSSGNIHTFAQLDRDRKRVPKGCKLLTSMQAECINSRNKE